MVAEETENSNEKKKCGKKTEVHSRIAGKCGEKTEVYSRVVGYYRPVQNWNIGKQEEFKDRLEYDEEKTKAHDFPKEQPTDKPKEKPKEKTEEKD